MTTPTPGLLRSVATWCGTQDNYYRDGYTGHDAAFVLTGLADNLEAAAATRAADLEVALLIADTVDGTPDDYMDAARAIREHYAQADDDVVAPSPVTIPVDATGLKGKRARIVGPLADLHAGRGFQLGAEVRIDWDSPNTAGYLACSILGPDGRRLNAPGAASSLALIPDEPAGHVCDGTGCCEPASIPEPVPEPPVGTRLRDKDGEVWLRDEAGWGRPAKHYSQGETFGWIQSFGPLHQVWESWADVPAGVEVVDKGGDLHVLRDGVALSREGHVPDSWLPRFWSGSDGYAPFTAVTPYGADQ